MVNKKLITYIKKNNFGDEIPFSYVWQALQSMFVTYVIYFILSGNYINKRSVNGSWRYETTIMYRFLEKFPDIVCSLWMVLTIEYMYAKSSFYFASLFSCFFSTNDFLCFLWGNAGGNRWNIFVVYKEALPAALSFFCFALRVL